MIISITIQSKYMCADFSSMSHSFNKAFNIKIVLCVQFLSTLFLVFVSACPNNIDIKNIKLHHYNNNGSQQALLLKQSRERKQTLN